MKKLLLSIISILFLLNASAQYVDDGQDSSSINWRQIDTKYFRLIYPSGTDSLAQKYANVFYSLYAKEYSSLNHKPRKMPIILHTEGGYSNGSVMWAPRRVNLYTAALQQEDAIPYYQHLSIHEYRHIIQVDKMNQGLTKFGSYIFGEHAPIGVLGVYVPMWFMEGDAVAFETGNTKGGRGRLPFFIQKLRAQLVEKGIYSYDKAVFGTFNDFTPNRYNLGYYMIANARKHYGTTIWENTINSMARRPWNIYSFERGIRLSMEGKRDSVYMGLSKELGIYDSSYKDIENLINLNKKIDPKLTLYHDNMSELAARWKYEDSKYVSPDYLVRSRNNKMYTSYYYPQYISGDTIIAWKDGLNELNAIVEITNRSERVLEYTYHNIKSLDYSNNTLVWSDYKPHPRWDNAGKQVLKVYDLKTHKMKRYSYKENIFNPSISPKGNIIAVAEDNLTRSSVVSFDKGVFNKVLLAKDGESFQMPSWVNDSEIVLVVLDYYGKHLEIVNLKTKERKVLTKSEYSDIANPKYRDGKVYFSSSHSGKDQICFVDINSGDVKQVSNARFGNRYPEFIGDKLMYSDYTAYGYRIVEADPKISDYGDLAKYQLADIMSKQEKPDLLKIDASRVFESKNYSRLGHMFKVHSWAPLFVNGFDRTVEGFADLGVSIASQNDLSTMFLVAGYKRDSRYNSGAGFAQLRYKAFWPVLDMKLDVGDFDSAFKDTDMQEVYQDHEKYIKDDVYVYGTRTHVNLSTSITLPFTFNSGAYLRAFKPYVKFEWDHYSKLDVDDVILARWSNENDYDAYRLRSYQGEKNNSFNINVFSYNFIFYNQRRMTLRDIKPKWGQVVNAGYAHSPFGDKYFGTSFYCDLRLYLPGLLENHSIDVYTGYQLYSDKDFPYERNIDLPTEISLWGYEMTTLKSSYTFPIAYPDYSLGGLMYTKRIYASMFYDEIWSRSEISIDHFQNHFSTGADLRADIHVFRFKTPVNVGVRYGYESMTKSTFVKLLFNVSFDI